MRVHVDATRPAALWSLWGMTLLERLLRQLARAGAGPIRIELPAGVELQALLRSDFPRDQAVLQVVSHEATPDDGSLVAWFDAAHVYDYRVVERLVASAVPTQIDGVHGARVYGGPPERPVERIELASMPTYLPTLRRYRVPFVLPIETRADLAAAERVSFEAVYKGVTDVVTKYLYPHLVRIIVKILAPTYITPNHVTAVSMVLSFGAVPVFATGHLGIAVIMGLVMSVLDSVDGKLARLTMRESRTGNWMDHGSDFVYFGMWLVAVGIVAGEGVARWVLPGAWLLDKAIVGVFKLAKNRELNDWAPIDAAFRLVVIRRNIFLLVLGAGVLVGEPAIAIALLAAWAMIGVVFHTVRALWIVITDEPPRASRLHGEAR
jgi:phosphatidylglycerophosphate synthase